MTNPGDSQQDPFMWWEDKQVAIRVNGDIVRGWVRRSRRYETSSNTAIGAGEMAIVLLIPAPAPAGRYPAEVIVPITADRGHGRPAGVLGLWAETDNSDDYSSSEAGHRDRRRHLVIHPAWARTVFS